MRFRGMTSVTLIGLALVGIGSGAVAGLNARQKAYTVHELTAHWKSPYDILVLPRGSRAGVGRVADPNALDEGTGGITLAQDERIASIHGVEVAAPIVSLGYWPLTLSMQLPLSQASVYRLTYQVANVGGPNALTPFITYPNMSNEIWSPVVYGLFVAVDPSAEARLMGLNKTVTYGHYFDTSAMSQFSSYVTGPPGPSETFPFLSGVPILLSQRSPASGFQSLTGSALTLPFSLSQAHSYLNSLDSNLISQEFGNLKGTEAFGFKVSTQAYWSVWDRMELNKWGNAGTLGNMPLLPTVTSMLNTFIVPGPVTYRPMPSPFPDRWPIAFDAVPVPGTTDMGLLATEGEPFRNFERGPEIDLSLTPIGLYDPSKVQGPRDPLTHLPLANYRMEQGTLVLSTNGSAVNPPLLVLPGISPLGLFTPAPTAITDIRDVEPILGSAPISSIRVKVGGVNAFSLAAESKIEAVAQAIRKATGLTVEVVRGASPQQVLIHPGYEPGYTKVGWVEEDWIRLGAGMEILRQALLSQDVILFPVLFGALVFALTAGVISVEVRKKEYATLLALGVMPRTIWTAILREGLLYGAIVFVLAMATAVLVGGVSALGAGLTVAIISAIVMSLALVPVAQAASRIDPLLGLRDALPSLARVVGPGSTLGMGLSLFLSSLRRHIAALVALLVPGGIFYLIFMVKAAIHHTLFLTALGHYILVHVSPLMQWGALVAVALAILASAQIGMRNATLRGTTWSIGRAMGWPTRVPVVASLFEAGVVGFLSGFTGATVAALIGDPLFGVGFQTEVWAEAIGVIVLSGLLAAIPSAVVISRQEPLSYLRGEGA